MAYVKRPKNGNRFCRVMRNVTYILTGGMLNSTVVLHLLSEIIVVNVLHHARDALTFSPNRLTSELRCLEWALKSMRDLASQEIVIGADLRELIDAVMQPLKWPRFRILL